MPQGHTFQAQAQGPSIILNPNFQRPSLPATIQINRSAPPKTQPVLGGFRQVVTPAAPSADKATHTFPLDEGRFNQTAVRLTGQLKASSSSNSKTSKMQKGQTQLALWTQPVPSSSVASSSSKPLIPDRKRPLPLSPKKNPQEKHLASANILPSKSLIPLQGISTAPKRLGMRSATLKPYSAPEHKKLRTR